MKDSQNINDVATQGRWNSMQLISAVVDVSLEPTPAFLGVFFVLFADH